MAVKKTKHSSESLSKTQHAGLPSKLPSRIRTAEGWRRSLLRQRKSVKSS